MKDKIKNKIKEFIRVLTMFCTIILLYEKYLIMFNLLDEMDLLECIATCIYCMFMICLIQWSWETPAIK